MAVKNEKDVQALADKIHMGRMSKMKILVIPIF